MGWRPPLIYAAMVAPLLAATHISCASPTIAFRIPTRTLAGAEARAEDLAACERAAAPGSAHRDQRYAACMIARGYVSWVDVEIWRPVPTGGGNIDRKSVV